MVEQSQIDHLLQETGEIPAPPHVAQQATLQDYEAAYARSVADPEGFWADVAAELEWFSPGPGVSVGLPNLPVVPGRQVQHHLQLPGPAPWHREEEQGRLLLVGRRRL